MFRCKKSIATILMKELVTWADHNNIKFISEINPGGDLDKEQLIAFCTRIIRFGNRGRGL
jgi:hypothetical protein